MQCCNKHVIIYFGARVSGLIRAIRSFISIDMHVRVDYFQNNVKKRKFHIQKENPPKNE